MIGFGAISDAALSTLPPVPAPSGAPPALGVALVPQGYDLIGAFDLLLPGMVLGPGDIDALFAVWQAGGYVPLTSAQAQAAVLALHGALPAALTHITRLDGFDYDQAPTWFNGGNSMPIVGATH